MRMIVPLACLALGACTAARTGVGTPAHEAVPFSHDDYPRALAEARQRSVPLFVEAWAPW